LAPPSPAPQDIPRAQLLQLRSRGRTASTFFEHPICTQCILSLHTLQSIRHASWTQANESPSSSRASRCRRLSPTTQPHRARTSHSAPSFLLSAAGRRVRRQSSFCGPITSSPPKLGLWPPFHHPIIHTDLVIIQNPDMVRHRAGEFFSLSLSPLDIALGILGVSGIWYIPPRAKRGCCDATRALFRRFLLWIF